MEKNCQNIGLSRIGEGKMFPRPSRGSLMLADGGARPSPLRDFSLPGPKTGGVIPFG
jgi:hypothetical protein